MAKSIKGNKEVDSLALQKNEEACQYVTSNINQLSQDVLMGLLALFDQTKIHLNRALDWRLKQGQGGKYVARIKEQIDGLSVRIASLEGKVGTTTEESEEQETMASEQ